MIFEKSRWEIWSPTQHPYKHSLNEFGFANPALPDVTNLEDAMNWMIAVLYPNSQPAVATVGDLPAAGNTINDYRIVTDDGDGKAASYRWEQREGDVAAKWYKIYDMDWGEDTILSRFENKTQNQYVYKRGLDDLDSDGVAVAGLYAGQSVYGGSSANTNLTLFANSGDGTGAGTGYVQVGDDFRPDVDDSHTLGTATERFTSGYFSTSLVQSTMTLATGSITDTTGTIDFSDENLTTTGNITGATVTGSSLVADDTSDTMTLVPGSITDTTGAVSFGAANLSTTGTLGAGVATFTDTAQTLIIDPNVGGAQATILSSLGEISFGDENLITTGTFQAGAITGTQLDIDNIRIDANTISSTNTDGDINIVPDGTGVVSIQKLMNTLGQTVIGAMDITGQLDVDNLQLNGNTLASTDVNGNIIIEPNGTGTINFGSTLLPVSSGSFDLGAVASLLNDVYLSGGIRNATNEIPVGVLLSFRHGVYRDIAQTQPAQDGDALFYDSINGVWLASVPDAEVDHTTIANITVGDAGHTQFVMLAGRAGGQVIQGGTAAGEDLTLESTSNASKGTIFFRDTFAPETNASYSGGWSGTDLGDATHYINDVFTKGEFKGFRFENYTSGTLPSASAQNVGRAVWATDNNKLYGDIGGTWQIIGVAKFNADTVWDGATSVKDTDVSATIEDARNAIWQLKDNANNFEVMGVKIEVTSASNVRITSNIDLPAGSYRLTGLE